MRPQNGGIACIGAASFRIADHPPGIWFAISAVFWSPESTSLVKRPTVQMDRSVVMDSRMGVRYPAA